MKAQQPAHESPERSETDARPQAGRGTARSACAADLPRRVRQALVDRIGVQAGDSLLLAVSGGPDSMALTHLLAALRPAFPLHLHATYIDHGLRPRETPAEWALVRAACGELGVRASCIAVDVHGLLGRNKKLSLEQAARELRYQALERRQEELGARWLALAHTADDQVEELLLKLLRGGSRQALAGMSPKNGSRIRPLLEIGKAELLNCLAARNIAFCRDSSNDDPRFLRNRIRHRLLPLLEQDYDAGIRQALLKCADNLAEDEMLLKALQEDAWARAIGEGARSDAGQGLREWTITLPAFRELPPALQRRILERLLYTAQGAAAYAHIMALLRLARTGRSGQELHLRQGLRALVLSKESLLVAFPWGQGPSRRSCKER